MTLPLSGHGLLTACALIGTFGHLCLYNYVLIRRRRQPKNDIFLLLVLILFRLNATYDADTRCRRKEDAQDAHYYQDTRDIIRLKGCCAFLRIYGIYSCHVLVFVVFYYA
jgi:hypothetical protein